MFKLQQTFADLLSETLQIFLLNERQYAYQPGHLDNLNRLFPNGL